VLPGAENSAANKKKVANMPDWPNNSAGEFRADFLLKCPAFILQREI
jgi:hypothetical protein